MLPTSDAIVGVLSILLGFVFGEISARLREAQTTQRQVQSTRAMLRYEITHNLQRLQQTWQRINPQNQVARDAGHALYLAEQLAEQSLIPFGRDVFMSQLAQFATALSTVEVTATLTLYDDFAVLDEIYQKLGQLQTEQRSYNSGAPFPTPQGPPVRPPATPFRDQGSDLWQVYQETALRCLSRGSPLG